MGFELRIFQALEGKWMIVRSMRNYGTLEGRATFSRQAENEYKYEETGKLYKFSGDVFDVAQKYIYRFEDNAISVYFHESPPRFFHTLVFDNPKDATACHICVKDHYEATYHFENDQSFRLKYKITGPKKDDIIETLFTKILGEE